MDWGGSGLPFFSAAVDRAVDGWAAPRREVNDAILIKAMTFFTPRLNLRFASSL